MKHSFRKTIIAALLLVPLSLTAQQLDQTEIAMAAWIDDHAEDAAARPNAKATTWATQPGGS